MRIEFSNFWLPDYYKGIEIVKIDFPETLAVCNFCRKMNKNAYIIPPPPPYLKKIFWGFKLKIACFELAVAKTLYKEYYMHFIITRQDEVRDTKAV